MECTVCGKEEFEMTPLDCPDCQEVFCREHYHGHDCDSVERETGESKASHNSADNMTNESVYCQECGERIPAGSEYCPSCGSSISGFDSDKNQIGKSGYTLVGIISGAIALILFPPVFGIISIFSGSQLFRYHNEQLGMLIMAWGGITLISGVLIGASVVG